MESNRLRIDSIDLSKILSKEDFSSLKIKKFKKGNLEYEDGSLTLYVFKSGKAKAMIYEDGEEFVLYFLKANNIIIPETSCAIEFLEDSEVYLIDADKFANLFANKEFSTSVIRSLKHRAELERNIIKNLVFKSCKKKISSFLIEIATTQDQKRDGKYVLDLNLSIKTLSSFIGSKRQTVSTIINDLKKKKIIEKIDKNKYIIHKLYELENFE
ncbi:hypothetical protein CP960_04055 [Malaciobacter halophilus]|uniref:HTH crp-type domain-containing protein n=1 Tax=Malaciobacter halophilus TaxID=197482 RepID=A0A2N1J4F3_9BACT|nr:Crp/Fnr family transcriptional regulator [Malaciobacter halophilus]AXH09406.1 transcriptional regulator, Crp/Fnr family [Malaciobacter halophilus]PKI81455.1 hypothetical protein CP960_04055 [Malaciobacter halophilus]